jgi:hypothetical protein
MGAHGYTLQQVLSMRRLAARQLPCALETSEETLLSAGRQDVERVAVEADAGAKGRPCQRCAVCKENRARGDDSEGEIVTCPHLISGGRTRSRGNVRLQELKVTSL